MKTLLKLIVVASAFGFATVNAEPTTAQKAAIQAVKDAVATGNEETVKTVVSQQVFTFPELAGALVEAGLKATNVFSLQSAIVKAAAFTAPDELPGIISAINASLAEGENRRNLISKAKYSAKSGISQRGKNTLNPPQGLSTP